MDSQLFFALRERIGSSFLSSFFPQETRDLKSLERNIDRTSYQHIKKLTTTVNLTTKLNQSLARVLTLLGKEIDESLVATDNLQAQIAAGSDVIAGALDRLEQANSSILGLIAEGYLLKKWRDRRLARKAEAKARIEEEARLKAEAEAKGAKIEPDAKIEAEPRVRAPELEAPRVKPKIRVGGGVAGLIATVGLTAAASYGVGKLTEGVVAENTQQPQEAPPPPEAPEAPEPQALAQPVQYPGQLVPPPAGSEPAPPASDPPPPPPPPDLTPYSPPDVDNPQGDRLADQAASAAKQQIAQNMPELQQQAPQGGGGGESGGDQSDTMATFDTRSDQAGDTGGQEIPVKLTTLHTAEGASYQVNAYLAPNFDGFVKALEATGYKITSIGGYANRNIAGKNTKSFHASGAAIDINPQGNPHLKDGTMQTDMPPNVAQIAAQFGLGWGGSWKTSKDTMHFSAAASEGGSFNIDRNTHQITALAEGGKVHKPTLALIGEGGEPEYVVPQSKAKAFAHEMLAQKTSRITKKHTHYVVVPIIT